MKRINPRKKFHWLWLLVLALSACPRAVEAQTVLGKHPLDQILPGFWTQNTNANAVIAGLNAANTNVMFTNWAVMGPMPPSFLPLAAGTSINFATNNGVVTINATGGGGSQTPWLANINGAGFSLTNLGGLSFTNITFIISDSNENERIYLGASSFIADANGNATFISETTGARAVRDSNGVDRIVVLATNT